MKKSILLLTIMILVINILAGCTKSSNSGVAQQTTEIATEESDASTRQQMLFFSIYALEGLSSFALTQMIYEQPVIKKEVQVEYTLYQDSTLLTEGVLNDEASMALVPFKMAVDILKQSDKYKLIGVVRTGKYKLIGVNRIEDLKGKTIVLYDPSKSNGQHLTCDEVLKAKLAELNFNEGEDYSLNYEADTSKLVLNDEQTVLMVDETVVDSLKINRDINHIALSDESDFSLAMLINQSVVLIYPDAVSSLIEKFSQSCEWLSSNPEHLETYAEQLDRAYTQAPSYAYSYFDAESNWIEIKRLIEIMGYTDETIMTVKRNLYLND